MDDSVEWIDLLIVGGGLKNRVVVHQDGIYFIFSTSGFPDQRKSWGRGAGF